MPLPFLAFGLSSISHAASPRLDFAVALKGNNYDRLGAMTVDPAGNIYLVGSTFSTDLATPGAFQESPRSSSLYRYERAQIRTPPARSRNASAPPEIVPVIVPGGAEIPQIVADPGRPSTLYALSDRGLLRTSDDGETWTKLDAGLPKSLLLPNLAVAPSNASVMYVAFDNTVGIYKSVDAGATWQYAGGLPPCDSQCFYSGPLAVDPSDASKLLLLGLISARSVDGGRSWERLPISLGNVWFDSHQPNVAYAVQAFSSSYPLQPVKSTDGGVTWFDLRIPDAYSANFLLPDPIRPGTVYAGINRLDSPTGGIAKSTDGGATWAVVAPDLSVNKMVADTRTGILYATGGFDVYRSSDGFSTYSILPGVRYGSALAVTTKGTLFLAAQRSTDSFVAKLDPKGNPIFVTYLGGLQYDEGRAVTVDNAGNIYVAGVTDSPDFPFTSAVGMAPPRWSSMGFLLKLSPDGKRLVSATRVPGASPLAMALDSAGNIYWAGESTGGLPTTPGVAVPSFDLYPAVGHIAFALKFAPDAETLRYCTYVPDLRTAAALAVDSEGNVYLGGDNLGKLNPGATQFQVSTALGSSFANVLALTLDSGGNLFAAGSTSGDAGKFPTTPGAFQTVPPPYVGPPGLGRYSPFPLFSRDAFVAKLDSKGALAYSTLLGGESTEVVRALLVDPQGNTIAVGSTQSHTFPTRQPSQSLFNERTSFLSKLNSSGSDVFYSTYIGDTRPFTAVSLARDPSGGLLVAGYTDQVLETDGDVIVARYLEDPATPPVRVDAVVNTASLYAAPIAPGERITIRGSGFGNDARVLLAGQAIPVIGSGPSEILARVPDVLDGMASAELRVESLGQVSNAILLSVSPFSLAAFTQDQ